MVKLPKLQNSNKERLKHMSAFTAVFAVLDLFFSDQEAEIHAAEWTRAMGDLETFFVGEAVRTERYRVLGNAFYVARTEDDWNAITDKLLADVLVLGNRKGELFEKCPPVVLANFIAGKGGVVQQAFKLLHKVDTLADNMVEEISMIDLALDGLRCLASKDAEWQPQLFKATNLFDRLCGLKGGLPQRLERKVDQIESVAPAKQELKTKPTVMVSVAPKDGAGTQTFTPTSKKNGNGKKYGRTQEQDEAAKKAGTHKPFAALAQTATAN